MANEEIRNALKDKNLKHWILADMLGISENTLVRWLRKELSVEKKKQILKVIESYDN